MPDSRQVSGVSDQVAMVFGTYRSQQHGPITTPQRSSPGKHPANRYREQRRFSSPNDSSHVDKVLGRSMVAR